MQVFLVCVVDDDDDGDGDAQATTRMMTALRRRRDDGETTTTTFTLMTLFDELRFHVSYDRGVRIPQNIKNLKANDDVLLLW